MNIVPRRPFLDLDSIFSDWWSDKPVVKSDTPLTFAPRVDIREKDNSYVITADLPGVKKEDINVSIDNGILTLSATTENNSEEEKEGSIVRRERYYGSYLRRFDLGDNVQGTDIQANFNNGVLTLNAPKVESRKAKAQLIEIKS